ncbi:MAG TPA: aminopeptidase N [Rhodocyclaceae bacterium]|nr:aminopeptidase N [Rhodocyclaceae bacterium]
MMKTETPQTIHLKDYTPPPFLVDTVDMDVDFQPASTIVTTRSTLRRNPAAALANAPLVLDGEDLKTLSVSIDGTAVLPHEYALTETTLTLSDLPESFELQTVVEIDPDRNTRLSGLYRSKDGYFTQCEAQGFRRITWFQDRPDVMAKYTVTLHADKDKLPILLANGNPVAHGQEAGDEKAHRHWSRWEDPFPKPCYLFAIVAAKLEMIVDTYTTTSGRTVNLGIFVEPGKLDQCPHAMDALKKSMKWDEDTFGLECDLDYYMIVAVGDFNMGAMENKGLNIFNTKYVLARPDVATDTDYVNIDRVVAHEYFHNWTGNRVTCRDWFQLSLKEGLTVYRDQRFGEDVHNRNVTHIQEVRTLRAAQFPEDAGPMAHPVRPSSYMEINNFYTATVYEKGAQVIAMMETLIGKAGFRKGMDLYFERHDGQAVTCDDFFAAMRDASGGDASPLTPQFLRWYEQAGTPHVAASGRYDAAAQTYTLTLKQSCAPSPGQPVKHPYLIPVSVGLVGPEGADLPLLDDSGKYVTTRVLKLAESEQTFVFEGIDVKPVPSLLRGFSAPVVLSFDYTDEELTHLMAYDSDAFNRWEAGQRLAGKLILDATKTISAGDEVAWPQSYADAITWIVEQTMSKNPATGAPDWAFAAELLSLPGEATLAEQLDVVDPDALHAARNGLRRFIAESQRVALETLIFKTAPTGPFQPTSEEAGRRALRNLCLGYLAELNTPEVRSQALQQLKTTDNMTDQYAALSVLCMNDTPERQQALDAFHEQWQDEALVVDKWLLVQAQSRLPNALAEVQALTKHPSFDIKNPNKVYSLIRAFGANHVRFHAADGSGYRFIAEQIITLDALNPQVASRIARCFDRWKKFDAARQQHAIKALEQVRSHAGLSRDVYEIVDRALS